MFGGNLAEMIKKAQKMGEELKAKQEELAKIEFDVSVGGGMVKMRFNAKGECLSCQIDPEVIRPEDSQLLQDLVLSAVNEGQREAQERAKNEMAELAGGLNIPGLTT